MVLPTDVKVKKLNDIFCNEFLHLARFEDFHTDGKDSRAEQSVSDRRPSGQLINGCFSRGWSIGLFRMCNFSYLAVIGGKSNQEKANNLDRVRRTLKIIF